MPALPDGTYDAVVVDADEDDATLYVDLTLTTGEYKGEVISVRRPRSAELDAVALLGIPATVHVEDGRPRIVFDRG